MQLKASPLMHKGSWLVGEESEYLPAHAVIKGITLDLRNNWSLPSRVYYLFFKTYKIHDISIKEKMMKHRFTESRNHYSGTSDVAF